MKHSIEQVRFERFALQFRFSRQHHARVFLLLLLLYSFFFSYHQQLLSRSILIDHAAHHVDLVTHRFIMIRLIDFAVIIFVNGKCTRFSPFLFASKMPMLSKMRFIRMSLMKIEKKERNSTQTHLRWKFLIRYFGIIRRNVSLRFRFHCRFFSFSSE